MRPHEGKVKRSMSETGTRPIDQRTQAAARTAPDYPWLSRYPSHLDWHQRFEPSLVYSLLDDAVAKHGSRPCTNFLGRTLSYAEIGALVSRTAAGLQALGVKKGTKVGLLMPNCPAFIVYYFAILKAGGTVVNYNPLYSHEELTFQVRDSETSHMVTLDLKMLFGKVEALLREGTLGQAIVASFAGLLPGTKAVLFRLLKGRELASPARSAVADRIVLDADLVARDGVVLPPRLDPDADIAVLQYTGGTTGTPKGAMLSHANVSANVAQGAAWASAIVSEEQQERVLAALPFFHVFAMTAVMNFGLRHGSEIVIMPRFVVAEALKLIDRLKPTVMPAVPTMLVAILGHPKRTRYDLTSLKYCVSGGAALPVEVKQAFEAVTGAKVVEGYGLSEASPAVTCNPPDGPVKPGSIGLPLPATIVSLRDLADPATEAPTGEKGEICVNGPQVMKGYWKRPEETAHQLVGGFLRTGDVAVMDEDGFLFIVDRIKDLIISSGYNVYPRRIEDALYQHPAVEEATVIGIKDDYRGEAPKAFVKLRAGATATVDELRRHLEGKISKIEMPAEIELRQQLPKTMIGKLSKKELKAEEEARRKTR
ncbi:MAG TPA: long-chain fatty acid--CoA ligase [Hyphomicrobiaceae bacterium]|nr:long-chain fatty acid--CoA ligase [Hyphomicrobiaceae bacterium]